MGELLTNPFAILNVGLGHYLVLSSMLFALGLVTISTRKNAVGLLMGVELVLNAASINFIAFSRYVTGAISGHVFSIFIIVFAAAEAAIALAIVLAIFQNFRTISSDYTTELKH